MSSFLSNSEYVAVSRISLWSKYLPMSSFLLNSVFRYNPNSLTSILIVINATLALALPEQPVTWLDPSLI